MLSKLLLLLACATCATATWKQVATLDIVALDLVFTSVSDGYISGGVNGQEGILLAKSVDSGKTWNMTSIPNTTLPLSISMAANPPHILVNGLFGNFISHDDGATWGKPAGEDVTQALSAKYEVDKFFLCGLDLFGGAGIATSADNGASFQGVPISALKKGSYPRFSAAPSSDVWYVSAGAQPQDVDDDAPGADDDGPGPSSPLAVSRRLKHTTGGNVAQIVKTSDAGKTWESLMYSTGEFYFMDIDCSDAKTCCVNSEADQMSPKLGIAIYCTFDGQTFNTTYTDYTPGQSLMDMKYLGDNKWVASGTFDAGGAVHATFVRSSDNGRTWQADESTTTPQLAVTAASYPTPTTGYALGIDRFNSEMLLAYSA